MCVSVITVTVQKYLFFLLLFKLPVRPCIDVKLNPVVMTRYELLSETTERKTMMLFNVEIKCFVIKLFFLHSFVS